MTAFNEITPGSIIALLIGLLIVTLTARWLMKQK
jgi:hypothetical protein